MAGECSRSRADAWRGIAGAESPVEFLDMSTFFTRGRSFQRERPLHSLVLSNLLTALRAAAPRRPLASIARIMIANFASLREEASSARLAGEPARGLAPFLLCMAER
jgi:hypothetical protein